MMTSGMDSPSTAAYLPTLEGGGPILFLPIPAVPREWIESGKASSWLVQDFDAGLLTP